MSKYIDSYAKFLNKKLAVKRPLKVVFDCSNGTTGIVLKRIMNKESRIKNKKNQSIIRNSKFIILNSRPDGNFPAHGPNPLIPGAMDELQEGVIKERADLGVAFDADGDRVFFIDNLGRKVDAHEAGYILMQVFKPPFVVSEISSWRLKNVRGAVISAVGHYFFKTMMRKRKASLGLEHSGHFYFKDFFYCDSGILAAIEVINFVSALDGRLSDWLDSIPKYYRSGEINFKVSDKNKILKKIEEKYGKRATRISRLDGLTMEFKNYWFNVRPSNTENLLRLNVESSSKIIMEKVTEELSSLISG